LTQTFLENIAVPPSPQALAEAEVLAGEILKDIELSQIPLSLIVLKTLRLARIVNDFEAQQIFEWESGGYPQAAKGVPHEVRAAAEKANRVFFWSKSSKEERTRRMYRESIEELESYKEIGSIGLQAADHAIERTRLRSEISTMIARLASRHTFIYSYASRKYYELNFGGVANDAFGRIRLSVDSLIGKAIPESVRKFSAIYDNLKSNNPEDWANAVHGCRRVLQGLVATGDTGGRARLEWTLVPNASTYKFQYRESSTDNGNGWTDVTGTAPTSPTYVRNLGCRTYDFRVSAQGDGTSYNTGWSDWSEATSTTVTTCTTGSRSTRDTGQSIGVPTVVEESQ
jgi:hypothetical protein